MKRFITLALATLSLAACEPQEVVVEKIVEVPVEVEVDTSDMPDGLKEFVNSGGYDSWIKDYFYWNSYINQNFFVISYGKNTIYTNSNEAPSLSRDVITIIAYNSDGNGNYEYLSHEHVEIPNEGNVPDFETFPDDVIPIFNDNFFDENQYVYKIIHRQL